jgi:hypothetical protein
VPGNTIDQGGVLERKKTLPILQAINFGENAYLGIPDFDGIVPGRRCSLPSIQSVRDLKDAVGVCFNLQNRFERSHLLETW